MEINSELRDGIQVLSIKGDWTSGPSGVELRDQILGLIAEGHKRFVLELSQLGLLNSIGLGGLVSCFSSATREGAQVRLAGMSARNRRAAFVSRILDLFDEFPDLEAALADFGPADPT